MTEKLILNDVSKISRFSIPEQIVVTDVLKQNELYSLHSGYFRDTQLKVSIKKYKIDDNLIRLYNDKYEKITLDAIIVGDQYSADLTNTFFVRELIFLQHLNKYQDSGVIKFLGISITNENVYLIFEEMGEYITFDKYIEVLKNKPQDNDKIRNIFYNLLTTINVFHSLGIVHCDFIFDNIMVKKYEQGYDMKIYDLSMTRFLGLGPLLSIVSDMENKPNVQNQFISDKNISYSYDAYSVGLFLLRVLANMDIIKFIQQGGVQKKTNPYLNILQNNIKEKELKSITNQELNSMPNEQLESKVAETIVLPTKSNPYMSIYQNNVQKKQKQPNYYY